MDKDKTYIVKFSTYNYDKHMLLPAFELKGGLKFYEVKPDETEKISLSY